jgi:acyl-CoA synthetase (NDP forming)
MAMLALYDVPVVAHEIVASEVAAVAAAVRLGFPVALKTAQPGILHKTDVGGVHLGLNDASAVRRAWQDIASRLGPRALVARMAARARSPACCAIRSSAPVATVRGGVLIELGCCRAALAVRRSPRGG